MFNSFVRTTGLGLILCTFLVILGCSSGTNPTSPPDGTCGTYPTATFSEGSSLGEFALYLDNENLDAKIEPVARKSALNVTAWADIHIVGIYWDEINRIWDIDLTIGNPTNYTAYGPWVVFRDIGNQRILDQDGFTEWRVSPGGPTKRVPVKAFAKINPERRFYKKSVEPLHLRIRWPGGVNSWTPLYFIIDVSYPGPRQEPIVEDLTVNPSWIPGSEDAIMTAHVRDWQVPPYQADLDVTVDLTPIGGLANEPLFDDGMHEDGIAGDGIWGCIFSPMPTEPVTLIVNANDREDHHFENEIFLGGTTNNLTGTWEGTAQVEGIEYLKTGTFPVKLHLVQRDDRVRGVLDVNQDAGFMAEWFGYYLEGTVSGDLLSIELTDRICGAGDPQALCAPQWGASKVKVFEANLQVGEDWTLSSSECHVKDGITYTGGVPIEPPFTTLSVSLTGGKVQFDPVPFAGKWKGPFNPPFSVVYAGIRMFGINEITFEGTEEGGYALTRFDNNVINIYPTFDDIILADSFRYDASSKRFWFVEAGTVYGTWLWIGEVIGDTIVGHFLSDPIDQRIWKEDTAPVDPFDVPFEYFEATFVLKKQ